MLNNCTFNDKTRIFTTFLIIFRMMKVKKTTRNEENKQFVNWEILFFMFKVSK